MPHPLLESAQGLRDEIVALRRDLHRHPELSFREERTAEVVAGHVEAAGWRVRTGVGGTGVVAELGAGDPVIALRADMDALPIAEEAGHDYASTVEGVMHACGHDAHCAGLVGAARLLSGLREEGALPAGTVRLLFQPAEETVDEEGFSGASHLVAAGAMEDVRAVVGLHVGGHLPTGAVFLRSGPLMAGSAEIRVEVRGRSAHGARPQDGVDALALACQGVVAAQQAVSRRISPLDPGVVTFGRIEGGAAPNVLADRIRLHGTLRHLRGEVREALEEAVTAAFRGLEAQGAEVDVSFTPGYPPVVNDPEVTEVVEAAAREIAGGERVSDPGPMMEAEDFGILAREAPGCFVWLGAALPEPRLHHHPRFDVDEDVLPTAGALLAASAVRLLERG